VAATGFVRGDEERGIVDMELAVGTSRPLVVASRAAAFAIAMAVASAAAGLGFVLGVISGSDFTLPLGLIETCALLAAIGLCCYGITLLIAQLVSGRAATAVAGSVLLGLYLLNSAGRIFSWLSPWAWLSPFHYYELSRPLPPGVTFDPRGLVVLLGVAFLACASAAALFMRRDVGAGLFTPPVVLHRVSREPSSVPLWSIPVLRGVWEQRVGLLAWCLLMGILAAVFAALARTIVQVLLSIPTLLPYLSIFVHQRLYPAVLGYTWYDIAQLLFAGLAITYVARWAAEDGDGRLEVLLSAPLSRAGVVVERMAVLTAGAAVIGLVSAVVLFFASRAAGIEVDAGQLTAACLLLVPFMLVFAGAGALLTAWNPRAAVALLGAFALLSYLDNELGAIYHLPGWVQSLSAFRLIGTPLVTGVDTRNLALLLLLAAAGVGSSILAMQRRDVGA
jgi:ABC-2 type transport system permease protein